MNVARHYGLQLPEFPYETVTFSRGRALQFDCANALSAGETTLVRCVDMYDETPATHLLELLRMVDGEHQRLVEIGEKQMALLSC